LRLLHGEAVISKTFKPDKALDVVMRIPGFHSSAGELTWWRGLSEYSSQYLAVDDNIRFVTGGVCLAKLDQRLSGHCQLRVLNDDGRWSGLFRFQYSGYRAKDGLERPGSIYSIVYLREFDSAAGHDHLWLHDVVQATPLSTLLHLVMRKMHCAHLASGRLQLLDIKELEVLNEQLLDIARMIFPGEKSGGAGIVFPLNFIVHLLLQGYYREIDGRLYFVPPGMKGESSDTLRNLDCRLESLQGKDKEGRNFFRQFLSEDETLKSIVLTWLMARINAGLRPWIPREVGILAANKQS
jgi:hypothetical protein